MSRPNAFFAEPPERDLFEEPAAPEPPTVPVHNAPPLVPSAADIIARLEQRARQRRIERGIIKE